MKPSHCMLLATTIVAIVCEAETPRLRHRSMTVSLGPVKPT